MNTIELELMAQISATLAHARILLRAAAAAAAALDSGGSAAQTNALAEIQRIHDEECREQDK